MRRFITIFFLLAWAVMTEAAQQVVVPGGLANVEGNSSSMVPFGVGGSRFQQVFSASEFSLSGAPTGRIENIWFRLDANAGGNMVANYPGLEISLSTTSQSPDALSPLFADNSGTDQKIVYLGSTVFSATYVPGAAPQPFVFGLNLSTPFDYVPSRGNLLLQIRTSGGMFSPVPLDAQSLSGDSTSTVFASSEIATSGTPTPLGLVVRFDIVPIPERASLTLLGLGCALLLGMFRGRSRRQS